MSGMQGPSSASQPAGRQSQPAWPLRLALRMAVGLCAGWAGLPAQVAAQVAAQTAAHAADAARGRLLYETGADATGRALQATRLGAGALPRSAVACVNCHRPSTVGGIEGGLWVPPITGSVLFAPGKPPSTRMNMQWMRHQTRSAYTPASFGQALRQGLDPDGRPLGPEMPRYTLDGRDLADLEAYLRARGQEPVPGLVDGRLHVATVFTPEAPAARRDTVMKVMQAWSVGLTFGPVPVVWHAWQLQGAPQGWAAQLAALNRATPVFGLVSGAGGAHWQPVQDFCEQGRMACVLPSVDRLPAWTTAPRHTAYFSSGVDGEARMLAQALAQMRPPARAARPAQQRAVRQVWRGAAAASAVKTLAAAVTPPWRAAPAVEWTGPRTPAAATRDGVLVLWLDAADASAWLQANPPGAAGEVVLSAQLAPAQLVQVPPAWRPYLRWVSMRATPADFYGALAASLEPWAQAVAARGGVSPVEFADARAAAFLFGDAAGLTQGILRPDYLMERLETSVKQRIAASVYVQASLGPAQRVASKGGYLVGYRPGKGDAVVPLSPYLRAMP